MTCDFFKFCSTRINRLTFPPPGVCLILAVDPIFDDTFLVMGDGVDLDTGVEDLLLVAENT